MIRTNLRLAFRTLWKKKSFSFINISGLAIGLSSVLVILTYIREELRYDLFHINHKTVYRITEEYKDDVKQVHSAMNHGPMADLINGKLSGLKHAVRVLPYPAYVSADKVNKHRENNLLFADSSFFQVFSFSAHVGDLVQALHSPFSVVITRSMAQKYFNSNDPIGQPLYYEDERGFFTYYVTAVMDDVPQQSHFDFDFLFNMESLNTVMPWFNSWHYPPMYLYVQTEAQTNPEVLTSNIQQIASNHQPAEVKAEKRTYYAQPLRDIHLYSSLANEWQANAQMAYIKLFGGIAVFLLVIASINFMNLSTAQAAQRAREVGVRKVLGAFRQQLMKQFLGEAFVVSFVSLLVSLGIAELLLMTFFKQLLGKELSLIFLLSGYNLFFLVGLLIVISVLAGIYPAFYLSRFRPALTLKGKTEEAGSVLSLRRVLVVFQFFISGLLIIGTLVVLKQVDLLKNKNLGFDQEQLLAIKLTDRYSGTNYEVFKNELLKEAIVSSAGLSSEIPGGENFYGWEVNPEGFGKGTMSMNSIGMDEDYIPTYEIKILQGRNFSKDISTDATGAYILNEAAVKFLGWKPEEAVGKEFDLIIYTSVREERKGKIIGVAQDFNYKTLHHQVEPLVLYINKHPYYSDFLTVKVNSRQLTEAVDIIEQKWKAFHPEKPLEFSFLNDQLQRRYQSEMRISSIFTSFAVLSIVISSLGLFGLSAFSAQRRTKEIGIRKVMGASVGQIVRLLSVEYVVMILVANVLAWPLAYFASVKWLNNFPYRTTLGMEILLFTLLLALTIALLTVSLQSVKAALANPVKSLKNE